MREGGLGRERKREKQCLACASRGGMNVKEGKGRTSGEVSTPPVSVSPISQHRFKYGKHDLDKNPKS